MQTAMTRRIATSGKNPVMVVCCAYVSVAAYGGEKHAFLIREAVCP